MSTYKRFPCLAAASIIVIIFSGFAINAKQASPATETVLALADFDAVGDGVTDDGPALQRAINALADAGGGTLLIPAGQYLIGTPVARDFSGVGPVSITIQGVPSDMMPAFPTANGQDLAAGLGLASELIPATGDLHDAIRLSSLQELTIEHVGFSGRASAFTDAFVTIYLSDVEKATIRHCEFYGISTFGLRPGFRGGNIVRAVRSDLSIELSVFLGCTANSGAYAPIVENVEWKRFSMGLGSPLSWHQQFDLS